LLLELVSLFFLLDEDLRDRLEVEDDPCEFLFFEEVVGLLLRLLESMEEEGVRCFVSLASIFVKTFAFDVFGLEEGPRLTTLAIILSPVVWMALVGAVLVVSTGMLLDDTTEEFFEFRTRLLAELGPAN